MKLERVPSLTGDMNIPKRHKIPNDAIQIMDFYRNGKNFSEDVNENLNMEKYYEEIFGKDDGKHFQVSFARPQTVLRGSKESNIPNITKLEKPGYSKVENSDQCKKILKAFHDDTSSGLRPKYPGRMDEWSEVDSSNIVPDHMNESKSEGHGKLGYFNDFTRQNGYVSLPEKSRLVENSVKSNILSSQMFETDQISDESLYELQENVDRPSNQVDELKQKAPPLHIEFESLANGEYKRPKQNDYHEFQENRRAYGKCKFSPSERGLF